MKMSTSAFLLLALFAAAAGARDLQQAQAQAQAPAAATVKPVADLLFVLSADNATFTSPTTLKMRGVTSSVQFYGQSARAGVIPTANFTNGTAGAPYVASNGQWLNAPDAALYGSYNGSQYAVVLALGSPQYSRTSKTVTFNVTVLAAEAEVQLKTAQGVTNELMLEFADGNSNVMQVVQPGTVLSNAALFIDANKESLEPMARTKTWWWWWGPGWYGPGWGWGGCGWGCGWYGK